ncbi:unnamed protein product, partial [Allacma fusca]
FKSQVLSFRQTAVAISDAQLIREAFSKKEFSGRPSIKYMNILGRKSITRGDDIGSLEQRKFFHSGLNSTDLKNSVEDRILKEIIWGDKKNYDDAQMLKLLQNMSSLLELPTILETVQYITKSSTTFLTDDYYMGSVYDLIIAGYNTTSMSMEWLCLYLTKFPEIQRKFQDEIDAKIGSCRNPSLHDEPNMPYAQAVINETLRMS